MIRTGNLWVIVAVAIIGLCFGYMESCNAATSATRISGIATDGSYTNAAFSFKAFSTGGNEAPFSTDDPFTVTATIFPAVNDMGKQVYLYAFAAYNGYFFYNDAGQWRLWDLSGSTLKPALGPINIGIGVSFDVVSNLKGLSGNFDIYVAYKRTDSETFIWNKQPFSFSTGDMIFSEVPFPVTDTQKRSIIASDKVRIKGKDYSIGYNTILRSGDTVGGGTFGLIYDAKGQPIKEADGSLRISDDNDFASLLTVGNKIFMVSHFESRPGAMYLTELTQDSNGHLAPIKTKHIDFSEVRGGWVHCAGSVTPWNTHLGSEEYEPNAKDRNPVTGSIDNDGNYYNAMAAYYGGDLLKLNPYDYGWPIEVAVNDMGNATVTKHYAMGRVAYELAYVMPDERTTYISDDGTNVGLYIFIADKPRDLSSGTLYAMKWNQKSDSNGGYAELEWISLGHATNAEIKQYLDSKISFSDIFEAMPPDSKGQCQAGFVSINTTWGHECLKVKSGMEKAASRLETRRYAAMLGATTELRKEEGITYDPKRKRLYIAMSEIAYGMEDFKKKGKTNNSYDKGGPNHIKLPYNECGGIYALDLGWNNAMQSGYVAFNMYGLIMGKPSTNKGDEPFEVYPNNTCDINGIANPDNITNLPGYDTLIIGEDTGSGHQNDVIWAYNLNTNELTRIQTTPYGSETTSPYWYSNINGYGYLMSVIQHPYGESDEDKLLTPADKRGYTGYIGPFPALYPSNLVFKPVDFPITDAQKRSIMVSESVVIKGSSHKIGFNTILRSGDTVGGGTFGLIYDANGQPIKDADGSLRISNDNDFASLLTVGNKIFMVSHFESRPGAIYLTELEQNSATGKLSAIKTKSIDLSSLKGGWVHCAGSVTPWNSHLGSEEYEPDAEDRNPVTGSIDNYYDAMAAYYGGDLLKLNPYDYGWPIEIKVLNTNGDTSVVKHYALGRLSYELAYVMPDEKTTYISDDGTNVGFYLFVADTPRDLSSGNLFAMKWDQISDFNGGYANIKWIPLGHATDAEIKQYIDNKITFRDIFEKATPNSDGTCPATFTSINTTRGHECLKVKPGMEKAASRLETRRYAAMLGATTELRKEEGVTYDPDRNRLYVAISEIGYGMENFAKNGKSNTKYDIGGPNHIKLPYNECGGVYALDLGWDSNVKSQYVAKNMYSLIIGIPVKYPAGSVYANNTCDINGIANPDNITYLPGYDSLIIGEDTGSGHQNDVLWNYDLKSGILTRIQTTPYGSETTSPYWYSNINGYGYLMSVVQHPYDESDEDKLLTPADKRGYTGYIGPFPAFK